MKYIGLLIHHVFAVVTRLGYRSKRWFADRYHGKILTPEHAKSIITVDRKIPLQDLDQVVPYGKARLLLLDSPLDIAVFECPCRHARESPCQPTQVCMIVGQPFVDLVLDHHPSTSRRMSRQEALDLLEAEHLRGHIHVAWFKASCLDRFFAICNCCKCCCGGIDAMMNYGIPMMTSSGYVAQIAQEVCLGCGTCESLCAFEAIQVDEVACLDQSQCMGCGVCIDHCPQAAISLEREPDRGVPLDVSAL
jgi:ferredoxin